MDKKDLIFFGVAMGIGAIIGALAGLGLSYFPVLPVLAAGAIIATVPTILFCAYCIYEVCKNDKFGAKAIVSLLSICLASAAIGVGLAAIAASLFPGVMLGMGSAAVLGAVIGAIAPIAGIALGLFATAFIIEPVVNKVSNCFKSPDVEPAASLDKNEEAAATVPLPIK